MGVMGLFSLLEGNSRIYEGIHFKNSKLLVDGNNLAYYLYNTSGLDQNHGGENLAFQAKVQAFFKTLKTCEIKPYVVMDGGSGGSDIELNNRMDRQKAVLQKISFALQGKRKSLCPPFITTVFEQTLNNMKVPLVRCFGEADGQLAALAREWRCPVLSRDTDFYIYDLPEGVLPLTHFRWDLVETKQARSYIPCNLYTTSKFCEFFNIGLQLLPLFALLAKNDYVNPSQKFCWARFNTDKESRDYHLMGLLMWLIARKDKSITSTLTAAVALIFDMSQKEQIELSTKLHKDMQEYQIPISSLDEFFSQTPVPPLPAEMLRWVPNWVPEALAREDFGANILDYDIQVNRRKFLRIQVEPSDLKSSNLTSKHIRQVLYGLLLGQGGGEVEEVDRVGKELVSVKVQPLVKGAAERLRLDSLHQGDRAVRLQVCLETLGVEEETLEGVPAHLQLPVAVTRYWLRRASPEPTLLKALLMVMVQGELKRQNGWTTGWQGDTNHLYQPLDGVVAHSFNQWQACLKDAAQLNLRLSKPLPEPHFAWLYQGRLVHRRQKELQTKKPEEIVHNDMVISLYKSLLEKVLCSLLEDYRQIYQDVRFWDSKLVVDGSSLAHLLHNRANQDQNHGGEYLAYKVQIQALFKALTDCGIKPYVVMDGGSGTSDTKLDTLKNRVERS
ncbi:unnamed protein product [Arctogadus glacialis]